MNQIRQFVKRIFNKVKKRIPAASIRKKLLSIFVAILLLFSMTFFLQYTQVSEVEERIKVMADSTEEAILLASINSLMKEKYILINEYVERGGFVEPAIDQTEEELTELFTGLENSSQTDIQQLILEKNHEFNDIVEQIFDGSGSSMSQMNHMTTLFLHIQDIDRMILDFSDEVLSTTEEYRVLSIDAIHRSLQLFAVTFLLATVIGIGLIYFYSSRLNKRLLSVVTLTNELSDGNLAVKKLPIDTTDEIGQLSTAINDMLDQLKRLVLHIAESANEVKRSSNLLNNHASESLQASGSISRSMKEILAGAEEVLRTTQQDESEIQELSFTANEVTNYMKDVDNRTEQTKSLTSNGIHTIEAAKQQMTDIFEQTTMAVTKIDQLQTKSKEISTILSMITSISERTNLLAINASIEAARAGNHGKGFAVVASEVRQLAEQAGKAVKEVGVHVGAIQSDITEFVAVIGSSHQSVHQGTELMDETSSIFSSITNAVNDVAANVVDTRSAVATIDEAINQLYQRMTASTKTIEENAHFAEQVAASTQQQHQAMTEVTTTSQSLEKMSSKLEKAVKAFKQ